MHGPYRPWEGSRANPAKILVDPYARQITGAVTDLDAARGWTIDPMTGPPSEVDSLGYVPLSVVTPAPPPATTPRPDVPWSATVISEVHVRGYTKLHPEVPPEQRGTYLGLAHPAVVAHLQRIGVTAVELLPVTATATEPQLLERGQPQLLGLLHARLLRPAPGLRQHAGRGGRGVPGDGRRAARGGHRGDPRRRPQPHLRGRRQRHARCRSAAWTPRPTTSLRGGYDVDITGTGNTLDSGSPTVVRMVCDAMRNWATAYGVDGFRIDLASVLGRPRSGPFDPHGPLLTAITTDPVLSQCKLIAEPWDATGEGYRVGGFGVQWSEWNGRYRDAVRDFWRGHGAIGELASRLTGSEDLYGLSLRRPWASVNFVTAHDGFTLRDLVSYERKHNEANGEDNRDGTDDNRSQNFGVEGETCSPVVRARRTATARALLGTLLLSTGTPMLLGGDELWRTQGGNNNAYCHDDETSWVDWPDGVEAERPDGVRRAARGDPPVVGDPAPRPLLPRRRRDLVAFLGPPDGRRRLARRMARTRWACWSGSGCSCCTPATPRRARSRRAARSPRGSTAPATTAPR